MYTVDGLGPEGAGYILFATGSSVRGSAGRVDSSMVLPGMDGEIPELGSAFMPGALTLRYRMFVSTHLEFMQLIEKFNGVFGQRRKLLPIVHQYDSANSRVNYGIAYEPIIPELVTNAYAYYQVNLKLPTPFWRSADLVTSPAVVLTGTLTTLTVTGLDGTGPISDSLIRVKGQCSTVTIQDVITGDQITLNTALGATEYAVIDCANWSARKVTTDTWTGGTDISADLVSNRGRGAMFTMEPDNVLTGGRYRVRARATNPVSSPALEIRAKKSYH